MDQSHEFCSRPLIQTTFEWVAGHLEDLPRLILGAEPTLQDRELGTLGEKGPRVFDFLRFRSCPPKRSSGIVPGRGPNPSVPVDDRPGNLLQARVPTIRYERARLPWRWSVARRASNTPEEPTNVVDPETSLQYGAQHCLRPKPHRVDWLRTRRVEHESFRSLRVEHHPAPGLISLRANGPVQIQMDYGYPVGRQIAQIGQLHRRPRFGWVRAWSGV